MTRTPSSSDSAPATTAAADLAHRMPDDRAGPHPVGLHGGGQRDLHGEQGRLDPVDAGHGLGRRHRLGDREPGLARRSAAPRSATVAANTGSSASRSAPIAAHCEPCPENTHTGPRSSWPDRGLVRGVAVGDLAQARRSARVRSAAITAVRTGRCAAPARQRVAQVRQRHLIRVLLPPSRPAGREVRRSASAEVEDSANSSEPRAVYVGGRSVVAAWLSGACSTMACTLVPDIPYDDTAARRGAVVAVGRPRRDLLRHERVRSRSAASSSGSRVKCSIGGTTPCCSARIALISPTVPAADSVCPKLVFADPSSTALPVGAVHLRPGWRTRSGHRPGCRCRGPPPCRPWRRPRPPPPAPPGTPRPARPTTGCDDRLGAAVLIGGGAAHHRQDPVAVAQRIGQPLEQHHGAALGAHEPVGGDVERLAASGRREHALRRRPTDSSAVPASRCSRRPGRGRSRPRAGCGTPCARPADPTNTPCPPSSPDRAGPARRRSGRTPCTRPLPVNPYGPSSAPASRRARVVVMGQPDEHTRAGAGQRCRRQTGMLDRPPTRSPATAGAADRSRLPSRRRCRRTRRRNRRRRRGTRPTATPTDRAHRARGRSTRRRPSGRAGISVTRSSPRSNASHNMSGESMPPGSRQAIPMTATGITGV